VDAKTTTRAGFMKDTVECDFTTALIYKLRKRSHSINDQSSTFTEGISTSIQLLVIWRSNDQCRFSVRALLIKHSNTITWNENTLEKFHSTYPALLRDSDIVKYTWLLGNETVLMTTSKWDTNCHTFEITISKGTKEDDSMEPLWVSSSV
jgi:hypothetical protein